MNKLYKINKILVHSCIKKYFSSVKIFINQSVEYSLYKQYILIIYLWESVCYDFF